MECGTGIEQQKKIQDFILTSHLNLALCFLRLKEYSQVVENCNKVSWSQCLLAAKYFLDTFFGNYYVCNFVCVD